MRAIILVVMAAVCCGADATSAAPAPATAAAVAPGPVPIPAMLYITASNGSVYQFQQNAAGSWDLVAIRRP